MFGNRQSEVARFQTSESNKSLLIIEERQEDAYKLGTDSVRKQWTFYEFMIYCIVRNCDDVFTAKLASFKAFATL